MALAKEKQPVRSFETHELVPYACHLNLSTVVTKNVELIQFVKLGGSNGLSDEDFRAAVRDAINKHVDPSKIAIWIHTVRAPKQIVELGSEGFVKHIDILWKQALPDELRFANNIYISLVIDFRKFPLWQPHNFLRSLSSKSEEKRFNRIIEERAGELSEITDKIIEDLKGFGATKLEIVNRNGTYYSEPMEFLHKLTTFIDGPVPVLLGDISKNLYHEKFNFNLYTGQIKMTEPDKNDNFYGALITLKESTLLPASALKDLFNTGYELIISESIDFSFGNKKLPEYAYQKYVNSLTDDKKFVDIMGGRDYEPVPENFALSQVSLLVMRKTLKEFNQSMLDISQKLESLGIIYYLEDLHLERSFWAMLPGNFAFLKRQHLVSHDEIASFVTLGRDKFTAIADCMFGEPVTFFENHEGGAFSLHFLNHGQSNILISGGEAKTRQLLANLITAQAAKFELNIIFYDESGEYENFAKSINASYTRTLDFDDIKAKTGPKTVIVINSLKKFLGNENIDFISGFFDYAANKNATIICLADFADNCEALLPNFQTQIFLHGDVEKYADHFDLFEDEIKIIDLLEPNSFYFKHGYDELILTFTLTQKLIQDLLGGVK